MEGIINPFKSGYKPLKFIIYTDIIVCSAEGTLFAMFEHLRFGLESKIEKLNKIITNILNKIMNIDYDNKENLINTINIKNN